MFKFFKQVIGIMEIIEANGLVHGDIRAGNFVIGEDGSLKLLWAPFIKESMKLMKQKPYLIKSMNPAPEVVDAYST